MANMRMLQGAMEKGELQDRLPEVLAAICEAVGNLQDEARQDRSTLQSWIDRNLKIGRSLKRLRKLQRQLTLLKKSLDEAGL